MGTIFVVTSGKGGVGKSSTCAGIGLALCGRGKKVLLVDLDAGLRCLDLLLGIAQDIVYDLSDIINGRCETVKAIYASKSVPGLSILPAPTSPELFSSDDIGRLLRGLSKYYDYVLIDCPAGIGQGFEAAVACADLALVVTTADQVSMRDASIVAGALEEKPRRLIVNRFRSVLFRKFGVRDLDSVIDQTGIQLLGIVPLDDNITLWASRGQLPAQSKAAMAFSRIASRLEGENTPIAKLK